MVGATGVEQVKRLGAAVRPTASSPLSLHLDGALIDATRCYNLDQRSRDPVDCRGIGGDDRERKDLRINSLSPSCGSPRAFWLDFQKAFGDKVAILTWPARAAPVRPRKSPQIAAFPAYRPPPIGSRAPTSPLMAAWHRSFNQTRWAWPRCA